MIIKGAMPGIINIGVCFSWHCSIVLCQQHRPVLYEHTAFMARTFRQTVFHSIPSGLRHARARARTHTHTRSTEGLSVDIIQNTGSVKVSRWNFNEVLLTHTNIIIQKEGQHKER
jgi:hypothetical protein